MGEGGAIAPPAVIFNAVNDALTSLGVELTETPLTPRRLLEAIERAKPSATSPAGNRMKAARFDYRPAERRRAGPGGVGERRAAAPS